MMNKASQRNQRQSSRAIKEVKAEQQFESTLSQEQLQMLEQENHSMIEGFEQTLDQIKYHLKGILLTVLGVQRRLFWRYLHYKASL
jgi:hypothetical protein